MSCVFFEVFKVEYLIRKVRLYQHVDIKIDITQHLTVKCRRRVDVAVKAFQRAVWFTETKNVVPAIQPIELCAYSAGGNFTEQVVFYVSIKLGVEHQEREFVCSYARRPATMLGAVVLLSANENCVLRIAQLLPLGPVSQKLCLSLVSKRVIEHLLDHFKRHRRDVGTHASGFDHVNWMTQARGKNFSLPGVVVIDLDNLLQQDEAILTNVVQSPQEWADKRSSSFGGENRLGG